MTGDTDRTRPITLCVVNHEGERYLERALTAAGRSGVKFGEILVVDNASRDRGVALVRERFPEVTVVQLPENDGPAAARNAGFQAARNDLILFTDNDVALDPDCAGHLAAALASRPDALVAMPRVLYADRPDVIQYDGADCHFLGLMAPRNAGVPVSQAPVAVAETDSVVTCSLMVDRGRWQGGEPFDRRFIFNYEDHDFGVRSRILGHRLLSVPAATCLHGAGTAGLSFREGGKRSSLRMYCLMRNRWRILLQTYSLRTLVLLTPCLLVFEVFQLAGAARKGWLGIWLRAAGWILAHPGETLRRRREVQRARRTPDRAVLQGGPLPFTPGLADAGLERAARDWLDRLAAGYWGRVEPYL
ncbi:MAG: glycosyltransferase family 2 protein [Gemmatimonadales bacterium]